MRISLFRAAALAAACGWASLGQSASAADVRFVNYEAMQQVITQQNQQIAQQNDRLGQLEAHLASFADGGAAPAADGMGCDGGCGCNDCCGGSPGVTWEAELLYLKIHGDTADILDEFHPGFRLAAGWQGCEDLGFRLRYFDFENEEPGADTRFDVFTFDAEATSKFSLCNWNGTFSFGARYAELFVLDDDTVEQDIYFSIGPVVGVEMRRDVLCDSSLFVLVRESLLYGKDGENDDEDVAYGTTEIQIGAEYHRERCCGGTFFVRGAFEAQYFHEDTSAEESHGLMGVNFGVGLLR